MPSAPIELSLQDGGRVTVAPGSSARQALIAAGLDLADGALLASIDGEVVELDRPLVHGGELKAITFAEPRGAEAYRHTASHVMAQAVKRIYPDAVLAIGPAIEDGFYYDFGLDETIRPDDLPRIEEEMARIVAEDLSLVRRELPASEAKALFESRGESYKVELIEDLGQDVVTIYEQGEFADLCRGPHLSSTGAVAAFKLLSTAGAYWRGDENREMLQRIYGTAFDTPDALEEYIHNREEAEKRDHRRLGPELELFSIRDEIGPGLVIYHPRGAVLRTVIEDYLKQEHARRGYELVISPHIMRKSVWETSGHLDMQYPMYFFEIEGQGYGIKPMNCPAHIAIYKSRTRGHHELPIRYFELGTVYRHERSGVLHGLLRVRGFTQDDAHIFCTMEQAADEIDGAIRFAFEAQRTFGFTEFKIALSTRPDHSVGNEEDWSKATEVLKSALESNGLDYFIDEGEGVFYGPKIDVKLRDAIGRLWQGPTIQFDFNLPRRFEMSYVGPDNSEHTPVMIHRTVLGSMERYMGILIEHYAGAFPAWLAPVQVEILPIADRHVEHAEGLARKLRSRSVRVQVNDERETTGNKIRKAWKMKVPYMIVVGDREVESQSVSVRSLAGRDERGVDLERFTAELLDEIASRRSCEV
ncbi:MAG: threonine--tRNA ligase [Actinobacteria bacterium]|nr:threonine--tRNA ligase [Actinomycetota bacterium]MBU1942909.1 threonine--tRNA ligase [Actinomycetota bacterium]MBU2687641.1 threonine--tRNA ligase [Actinomycetota bacterium]